MTEWERLAHGAYMGMLILKSLAPDHADLNAAPGSQERIAATVWAGVERWIAEYEAARDSADNESPGGGS